MRAAKLTPKDPLRAPCPKLRQMFRRRYVVLRGLVMGAYRLPQHVISNILRLMYPQAPAVSVKNINDAYEARCDLDYTLTRGFLWYNYGGRGTVAQEQNRSLALREFDKLNFFVRMTLRPSAFGMRKYHSLGRIFRESRFYQRWLVRLREADGWHKHYVQSYSGASLRRRLLQDVFPFGPWHDCCCNAHNTRWVQEDEELPIADLSDGPHDAHAPVCAEFKRCGYTRIDSYTRDQQIVCGRNVPACVDKRPREVAVGAQ